MSDEEALGLGHPGEVDPEETTSFHAFRDVAGDDDGLAFVIDRVVRPKPVQGAARRSRGVVEALLGEMSLPRAFDSEMSLAQGDIGQRHESSVGEVGIFEIGVGRHFKGVVVDDEQAREFGGGGLDGFQVGPEPGYLLGLNRFGFHLRLLGDFDDRASEAVADEEADQRLQDTGCGRGGGEFDFRAADLGRARRLRVESMAEGEGLLGQVGGQSPVGELRVGTNKPLGADDQVQGAD